MGRRLGALWQRLDRAGTRLVRRNLEELLSNELTPKQIDAAVSDVFESVACGKMLNDLLPAITESELDRLFQVEGTERLDEALSLKRGVVLVGAHFGVHTYVPLMYLQRKGYEVSGVLGEETDSDDSRIYRWLVHPIRRRSRLLIRVIEPRGWPQRAIAECLRRNEVLMILGDVLDDDGLELPEPHVMRIPFLGRSIRLKTGPIRLAHWLGAPLVPYWTVTEPSGFRLVIEEPLKVGSARSAEGVRADLAAFVAQFERRLRANPGGWAHWRHNRFLEFVGPSLGRATSNHI